MKNTMKNKALVLLTVCACIGVAGGFFGGRLQAQQAAQFSQFFMNRAFYNPAAISADGMLHVALTDREQYLGSADNPRYCQLAGSYYFQDQNMGVGVVFHQWNQNIENNVLFKINYMYCLKVGHDAYINFGINAGVKRRFLSDGRLPSGEMYYSPGDEYNPNLDMGLGIEFHTSNIIAGVAVQNLPIRLGENPSMESLHSYYYFGYNFILNPDWGLMPMVAMRVAEKNADVDAGLRATYRDVLHFGASYRLDAVVVMAGVNISKNFGLSYSCDINIGKTSKTLKPSHEIVLTYRAMFKRPDRPMILSY